MSATKKQNVKQNDNNDNTNDEGKVPVPVETVADEPFSLGDTLAAAERDVEGAFVALMLFIASQSMVEHGERDYIITRLAEILTGEGKAPRASDDPSSSALNKRLKRLFGSKGILSICNMARTIVGDPPIIG